MVSTCAAVNNPSSMDIYNGGTYVYVANGLTGAVLYTRIYSTNDYNALVYAKDNLDATRSGIVRICPVNYRLGTTFHFSQTAAAHPDASIGVRRCRFDFPRKLCQRFCILNAACPWKCGHIGLCSHDPLCHSQDSLFSSKTNQQLPVYLPSFHSPS